jgi:hypothetical protein
MVPWEKKTGHVFAGHCFPERLHACDFIWVPQPVAHGPQEKRTRR